MISDIKPYPLTRTFLGPLIKRHTERILGTENLPLKTPFLVGANHIDFLDGLYIAYYISDRCYRKSYFLSQTNNYWMFRTTIKVNPEKPDQSLEYAKNVIEDGHCICIFPEGKRNPETSLLKGKTGLARLAMETRLPFIPVGIIGPSGKTFKQSVKLLRNKEERIWIQFGKPITYWEYYRQDATPNIIDQVTKHIMNTIGYLAHKKYPFTE